MSGFRLVVETDSNFLRIYCTVTTKILKNIQSYFKQKTREIKEL